MILQWIHSLMATINIIYNMNSLYSLVKFQAYCLAEVKSIPHGNNMEINEVKNQVIGRLLLQTLPPRKDRKGVVRPPTPPGGQG